MGATMIVEARDVTAGRRGWSTEGSKWKPKKKQAKTRNVREKGKREEEAEEEEGERRR